MDGEGVCSSGADGSGGVPICDGIWSDCRPSASRRLKERPIPGCDNWEGWAMRKHENESGRQRRFKQLN
jgi:hypothetical protein